MVSRRGKFGSRAQGDHAADSDYDIAVFIRGAASRWRELGRLAATTTDILADTGAVISAKPFSAVAYYEASPLMREIHRDGVEL